MSNRTTADGNSARIFRPDCFQWTPAVIERLAALWEEGLSAAYIGRRIGCSKNAVVGKAKRLELTPRPSPVKRVREGYVPKFVPEVKPRITLPPMPEAAGVATLGLAPLVRQYTPAIPRAVQRAPEPPRAPSPPTPAFYGKPVPCCYPIGEPRTREFRYCDVPSMPGVKTAYCEAHYRACHVNSARSLDQQATGPDSAWGKGRYANQG